MLPSECETMPCTPPSDSIAPFTAFLKAVMVVTVPGETPCAGASKAATRKPAFCSLGTKENMVALSAPQPCTSSTVRSPLPHRWPWVTPSTPRISKRRAPSGDMSLGGVLRKVRV